MLTLVSFYDNPYCWPFPIPISFHGFFHSYKLLTTPIFQMLIG